MDGSLSTAAETGRLGRKGGLGIYRYEKGKDTGVDPDIYTLLAPSVPASRVEFEHSELIDRLILVMVNEAARVLEDGITDSAGTVDLGMVMGTGFPPFRGGLLKYADSLGATEIVTRLEWLNENVGGRFDPAPALLTMAAEGRSFYETYA